MFSQKHPGGLVTAARFCKKHGLICTTAQFSDWKLSHERCCVLSQVATVLETRRIASVAFSFVSTHSFARAWPVFTSKDSEPSSQRHCWLRMYSTHEPSANISTHVQPQVHSGSTPMSRQWRWSMKNALSRTLSHPPHPPTHSPRNPPNQHPAYQHLCHVNRKEC